MKNFSALLRLFIGVVCFSPLVAYAASLPFDVDNWNKEQKALASNVAAYAVIGTWGVATWHYGERDAHFTSEDWFQKDTRHGGADKIGHAYATYGISHLFAYSFSRWGFARKEAALYGALSGLGLQAFMEVGDSFSDFGFSYQDFTMNAVGALVGYYSFKNLSVNRYVDFRVEYIPTRSKYDVFTDYQGIKYLAALKLSGFVETRKPVFKYLEAHIGYYARGYETRERVDTHRVIYGAVGVNIFDVLADLSIIKRVHPALRYYQLPFTYISAHRDLNQE